MRIAVTGGAGFIGAKLVARLVENHDVTIIDIVSPARTGNLVAKRVDIIDLDGTKQALAGCQTVYHLAGAVLDSVRKGPYLGTELNVHGTLNVLEACRINDVRKIIFASTFYVYDGIDPNTSVDENTLLNCNGMELFGASKLLGENLVRTYCEKYGLQFVILRFGSAYGPGNCSNIVKSFLESGLQNKPAVVWGKGNRWNQYTYVGDVAEGCLLSLGARNEIFNLISPQRTSIKELASLAKELLNLEVVFELSKKEGSSMPYMSSEKARVELKWKTLPIKDGIRRTIDEMRISAVLATTLAR